MTYATMFDRLVSHVVVSDYCDCWHWVGATRRHGGGNRPAITVRVSERLRPVRRNAARVMCELFHGPAPTPLHEASHLCEGNWLCIHPWHVVWETKAENLARRDERMRAARALEADADIEAGEVSEACPF